MANFNKVILAGNLTRDIQLTTMPSGQYVGECGMAINRKWRPKEGGDMREEVCFVDFRVYGRSAETLSQYVGKGKPLLIEGRLKFDSWEKDGQKRSKLYVIVDNFQFLGGGERRQSNQDSDPPHEQPGPDAASDTGGEDVPF